MIFVTVGTTGPFDTLLTEVDRLAAADLFGEPVVCQHGQSTYRMHHAEQFMARSSVDDLIAASSFVICHGGGGTVLQLLQGNKCFVAFANPLLAGDHQGKFLEAIARMADISWSRDVRDLQALYRQRRALGPARLRGHLPRADAVIRASLGVGV